MLAMKLMRGLLPALVLVAPSAARGAPPTEPQHAEPSEPTDISLPETAAFNRCDKRPTGERFRVTLPEAAELKDLVGWMSSVSCQKFVWDPAVRGGRVTIVAPEPVTLAEAYGAFHSALETMHLAVRSAGDFYEIVETKNIAGHNLPVVGPDDQLASSDRFVTQLVRPHPERIADVAAVFDHLKSEHGAVSTVGAIVIFTDTANNIRRAMKVAQQVDVAEQTTEGLFVYPLVAADAEELATVLREILGEAEHDRAKPKSRATSKPTASARPDAPAADATPPTAARLTRVIPDARTRSLYVVAPREDYPLIRTLIERLDTAMEGGQGEITVIRLDYAKPEELQPVLMQVIGARKDDASMPITVTAEPATRSLILDAPYQDTQRLKRLVASLDVERRQVYMEVYLLEVSVDHGFETGAGAHFARQNDDGSLGVYSTNPSADVSSLSPSASALQGLAAGIFGPALPGLVIPGTTVAQEIPSFGVMIQAIENDTNVNTISEPHVTTADNRTAKITVGEVIPFQNGIQTPGGADGNSGLQPLANVSRESVAMEIEITPHVNDKHEVLLDIKLLDEQAMKPGNLGILTSKRTLELQDVLAHDGQPVVLGGLIKDKEMITERKIPGLGSIPLIGWLFKHRERKKTKVNLLMVLVPHVINSPDDARRIHQRRMAERREFIERETSFKRKDLSTHVNYGRKPGLFAVIESEHRRMRTEDRDRQRAEVQLRRELPTELVAPETPAPASTP